MGVERYTSVAPLARDWDALAARVHASPFTRPGWIEAWWSAFGAGSLEIVALRRDTELDGVLPLVRRGGGLHAPVNWHTPEFGAVAADDDARRTLYDAVFADGPTYTALRFIEGDVESAVAAARAARFAVTTRILQRSPYVPLDVELPAAREKEMRKHRERLSREGEVSLEVVDGSDDLDAHLAEFLRLEGSGWKVAEGTAIVSQPATRRFYTEIARWAAREGLLRLCFLRVGERGVAAELLLEQDGHVYDLKGGYDLDYRKHAPGLLLASSVIEWSRDKGLDTFEFLGAAEPWKLKWTELTRDRLAFEAFSPKPAGVAARVAYTRGRPLAKRSAAALRQALRRT